MRVRWRKTVCFVTLFHSPLAIILYLCCDADYCRRGCGVGEESERGDGDFEVMYYILFSSFYSVLYLGLR